MIMRRSNALALAMVLSVWGCAGDDTVKPSGATSGAGAAGGNPAGQGGAGAAGGGAVTSSGQGGQGAGGSGGAGSGGGGMASAATAPAELNNASGRMTGTTYRLTFQLGRPIHQQPASGPTQELVCAAPRPEN